jgi:hypothetical protein
VAEPPPVPSPDSQLELQAAIDSWPAVVEQVRGENAMLAAALAAARPVSAEGRELVVAFPQGAVFFKRKAEQDDHRRVAGDALQAVTGHRVKLVYELRENGEAAEESGPATLSGEELVRRFMEEFDAEEILDDDPE